MPLVIDGTQGSTYGIHGNNNEKSIGKNVSHGCIRMHNSEVELLFDQVPVGTTVLINSDLIELVEETPDTVLTLTTGKKIIVKESRQEIKNLVILYRKDIFAR